MIQQPDGTPLTHFKTGPGPHTGVHLIIVRRRPRDDHPPAPADREGRDGERQVVFPAPGQYRVVVDVYPASGAQPNFQLFRTLRVAGPYRPKPLPPPAQRRGRRRLPLHARRRLAPEGACRRRTSSSTSPTRTASRRKFTPWFGALAHAIFFRRGSLDYFHTHVCAPGATGCTSILGGAKVTGTSTTPGKLTVGVLVPAPGTWRLFLQTRVDGRVLTAPFTLKVT